jgi:hypothetical protein
MGNRSVEPSVELLRALDWAEANLHRLALVDRAVVAAGRAVVVARSAGPREAMGPALAAVAWSDVAALTMRSTLIRQAAGGLADQHRSIALDLALELGDDRLAGLPQM